MARKVQEFEKRKRALQRKESGSGSSGAETEEDTEREVEKEAHGHVGPDEIQVWDLPDGMGKIKLEVKRRRFGAHGPLGGTEEVDGIRVPRLHGPGACRLNRVKAKRPLGLMGAWCGCADDFPDQRSHFEHAKAVLCNDFPGRLAGRHALARVKNWELLVEAEGGGNVEPRICT